jgi:hypothetical protein
MPEVCFPVGVAGLVLFSSLSGLAIALPWLEPGGSVARSALFAAACAGVSGAGAAGSLYLALAARRSRLCASGEAVRYVGVSRSEKVPLAEVTRAVWSGEPAGGRLALHTKRGRLTVTFGNYAGAGGLASFFLAALPAEVQERYERFESTCAPASEAFRRRQGREDRRFIALLPLLVLALAALTVRDPYGLRQWCAAPMAFMILMGIRALYSRWRGGRSGRPEP